VVHLEILAPATLPALRAELDRAHREREPYHVVHFDGHGVYDRRVGLGGLCFEDPRGRPPSWSGAGTRPCSPTSLARCCAITGSRWWSSMRARPQQAEQASESVASEILKMGVASVVAMSHSVLVETARRFVAAFYGALARGARVGDAMLEGQRQLKGRHAARPDLRRR